MVKNYEPTHID